MLLRYHLKDQLMLSSEFSDTHTVVLLEAVILLTNSSLPWACIVASHLQQTHAFALLRDIILTEAVCVLPRKKNQILCATVILLLSYF